MVAGTEKGALRNTDVASNNNPFQILQPAFLSQPDVVADGQLPRKSDFNLRFDGHIASDLGAKSAQHRPFEWRQAERTKPEQQQADQYPDKFTPFARAPIEVG